jgi:hypothetical protein
MDPAVFGVTWQEEAAANQAACVESAATIFASVFSADGAQLISGALRSQRPHPICRGLGVTLILHPNCSLRRCYPPCRRFEHGAHSGHGCQYDDTGERTRVTVCLRLAGLPACPLARAAS